MNPVTVISGVERRRRWTEQQKQQLTRTKTYTGRIWTYVRDDRPFSVPAPPAAIFHYYRDRRVENPIGHLQEWAGIFQVDTYARCNALLHAGRLPAPLTRACASRHEAAKRRRGYRDTEC